MSPETDFSLPLGYNNEGKLFSESLINVGNLIIAGNPPSHKEKLIDTFLVSLLLSHPPGEFRVVLIDPTHYLDLYNGIPHLLGPVVNDPHRIIGAQQWLTREMDKRMYKFATAGVRDISAFNKLAELATANLLPHLIAIGILSIPDEENTNSLIRLTGEGARTGIHSILVVEQTDAKGLPSSIKNNIPARVAFRLSSANQSRDIDVIGAENLLQGEIIYKPNFGGQVKLKAPDTPEVKVKETVAAMGRLNTDDGLDLEFYNRRH